MEDDVVSDELAARPWHWIWENGERILLKSANAVVLCPDSQVVGYGLSTRRHIEISEADACLIEAAPELLQLVIQYRDDLRRPPTAGSVERRLAAIADAIARATGAA